MNKTTLFLMSVLIFGAFLVPVALTAHEEGEEHLEPGLIANATKTDLSTFTIDGEEDDWANVPEYTITLKQLGNDANSHHGDFKIAYNDTHVAVLVLVEDNYNVNLSSHKLSPSMAVEWKIDEDAGPHMGTEGGVSTGKVDIWHWELEHEEGFLHTPNPDNGKGGHGLDDEWADSTTNRHDDAKENSLYGAWG